MNINEALAEWQETKDISLASDICSALVEMLEDEGSAVVHREEAEYVDILFRGGEHRFVLLKIADSDNFKRVSVLGGKDGE